MSPRGSSGPDLVAALRPIEAAAAIFSLVGTSLATQESVPAAFAVLTASGGNAWSACSLAASLGGDTDTIAAMAGAVAGACGGASAFPATARKTVAAVNELDLDGLASELLHLRCSG